MKKVFPLQRPDRASARVVESVKNEVRKYVKRERRKELPEGFTAWTFSCRAGLDQATAVACTLPELAPRIDDAVRAGATAVYIEVLAQPGHRGGVGTEMPADEDETAST